MIVRLGVLLVGVVGVAAVPLRAQGPRGVGEAVRQHVQLGSRLRLGLVGNQVVTGVVAGISPEALTMRAVGVDQSVNLSSIVTLGVRRQGRMLKTSAASALFVGGLAAVVTAIAYDGERASTDATRGELSLKFGIIGAGVGAVVGLVAGGLQSPWKVVFP